MSSRMSNSNRSPENNPHFKSVQKINKKTSSTLLDKTEDVCKQQRAEKPVPVAPTNKFTDNLIPIKKQEPKLMKKTKSQQKLVKASKALVVEKFETKNTDLQIKSIEVFEKQHEAKKIINEVKQQIKSTVQRLNSQERVEGKKSPITVMFTPANRKSELYKDLKPEKNEVKEQREIKSARKSVPQKFGMLQFKTNNYKKLFVID